MKKILQITVAAALTFSALKSTAQQDFGAISPDWTLTDINGISYNLYTYLNAGKTVFIDISTTWCSPCWDYHNSHAYDSLWTFHGPLGAPGVSANTTNDVMVFFIEGEGQNTTAQLYGPTSATGSYATDTHGDWVTGTDYPIFDPTFTSIPTVAAFNALYNISVNGFPSCIMICPDRKITSVFYENYNELLLAKSNCSTASVSNDAELLNSDDLNYNLASCDSVIPSFRLGNIGTSALTSAAITIKADNIPQKTIYWTGNLQTYSNTIVTGVKVGASAVGNHTISADVSVPNGTQDPTISNNTANVFPFFNIYPPVGGPLISESFENGGIPSTWSIPPDGNYYFAWQTDDYDGLNSSKSAYLPLYYMPEGKIGFMTLPPMSFTGDTVNSLTFDMVYKQAGNQNVQLEVQVSADCGTSWTSVYSKAGNALVTTASASYNFVETDWRHEVISLNTYSGQPKVLVRFKGTVGQGTSGGANDDIVIDNVNISSESISNIDAELLSSALFNNGLASCDSVSPVLYIRNDGINTLTSAAITYKVDGVIQKIQNWTGNIGSCNTAITTGVKVGALIYGTHTITAIISNPNGVTDPIPSNNSTSLSFIIYPPAGGAAIAETFENSGIPASWTFRTDITNTWKNIYIIGFNSYRSVQLPWWSITTGQIDTMKCPPMSFIDAADPSLTFDVAYMTFLLRKDKLEVEVSTDCGISWTTVYNKEGEILSTTPSQGAEYFPGSNSQWRHETINMSTYVNQHMVMIRFKGTSDFGNNLFIDNINVNGLSPYAGITENKLADNVSVFPNPAATAVTVGLRFSESTALSIDLLNTFGQKVLHKNFGKMNEGEHTFSIDVSSLDNGFYFLSITSGNKIITKKVAVDR